MKIKIIRAICVEHGDCLKVGSVHDIIDPPADRDPDETWVEGDGGNPVRLFPGEWEAVDTDLYKVRALLTGLGLTYKEKRDEEGSGVVALILYADQGQPLFGKHDLPVCEKLDGHPGRFEFQQDGKFIRLGFWEQVT